MALRIRNLTRVILLCVCAGLSVARGQSATDTGPRQFSVLPGGELDWSGLGYQASATERIPLTFSYQSRLRLLTAKGGELVFTRQKPDPKTGLPVNVPVARAAWPAGVRRALLVFRPLATPAADGMEFEVAAFDDDMKTFPADAVRVLNLTHATLLGRLGHVTLSIHPGASPVYALNDIKLPDGGIPIGLALNTPDGPSMLYLAPLEPLANGRSLVVVFPPKYPNTLNVRVTTISEIVPNL